MLEIVFLGTGSGPPTHNRNHSSIYFRYEENRLLMDCGEGTQRQLIKAGLNFMKVDHIFITHWHADHWIGLIGLLYTMNLESRKTPLYIHGPDAERFIGDILDLDYWGTGFKVIPKNVPYEGSKEIKIYETGDFEITSIPTKHSVPSVAYKFREKDKTNVDIKKTEKLFGLKQSPLIGKLKKNGEVVFKGKKITLKDVGYTKPGLSVVYSGDTEPCNNMIKISNEADLLIHDATFTEKVEDRMHTGANEAAEIAKKAKVKTLILTHFSRRYQNTKELEDEAKKTFKNSKCAHDFMLIDLKKDSISFSNVRGK